MICYINFFILLCIVLTIQYKIRIEKRPDGHYLAYSKYVWDELTRTYELVNFRKKLF